MYSWKKVKQVAGTRKIWFGILVLILALLVVNSYLATELVEAAPAVYAAAWEQESGINVAKSSKVNPVAILTPESQINYINHPASVDASQSYHPLKSREIVSYEFSFSRPVATIYQEGPVVAFFSNYTVEVTVTVTDDKGNTDSATSTVIITGTPPSP